jgi:hypothetical protein
LLFVCHKIKGIAEHIMENALYLEHVAAGRADDLLKKPYAKHEERYVICPIGPDIPERWLSSVVHISICNSKVLSLFASDKFDVSSLINLQQIELVIPSVEVLLRGFENPVSAFTIPVVPDEFEDKVERLLDIHFDENFMPQADRNHIHTRASPPNVVIGWRRRSCRSIRMTMAYRLRKSEASAGDLLSRLITEVCDVSRNTFIGLHPDCGLRVVYLVARAEGEFTVGNNPPFPCQDY